MTSLFMSSNNYTSPSIPLNPNPNTCIHKFFLRNIFWEVLFDLISSTGFSGHQEFKSFECGSCIKEPSDKNFEKLVTGIQRLMKRLDSRKEDWWFGILVNLFSGAEGGIRTRTPRRALDPESSASASSATSARGWDYLLLQKCGQVNVVVLWRFFFNLSHLKFFSPL